MGSFSNSSAVDGLDQVGEQGAARPAATFQAGTGVYRQVRQGEKTVGWPRLRPARPRRAHYGSRCSPMFFCPYGHSGTGDWNSAWIFPLNGARPTTALATRSPRLLFHLPDCHSHRLLSLLGFVIAWSCHARSRFRDTHVWTCPPSKAWCSRSSRIPERRSLRLYGFAAFLPLRVPPARRTLCCVLPPHVRHWGLQQPHPARERECLELEPLQCPSATRPALQPIAVDGDTAPLWFRGGVPGSVTSLYRVFRRRAIDEWSVRVCGDRVEIREGTRNARTTHTVIPREECVRLDPQAENE